VLLVRIILTVRGAWSQQFDRFSSITGGGFEREACASGRMFKIIVN